MNELTIGEARKGLDNKQFSATELTKACLEKIEADNDDINAFISINKDLALARSKEADNLISAGKSSLLTGIPFGAKDAICTEDVRSTGAAKILDNYKPPFEATVINKINEEGGILVGKQNCDAFGHGASNENSMYGPVHNPHDKTKVAGGSSGGSAAAVADNQCIFSIAEDTGGSIRQPASLCGVVGLRPSYGRNSRYGIMPMASSLDTVGPMTKTIEDMAMVMEVIAGVDPKDATTVSDSVPKYTKEIKKDFAGLRVGIPKEYFHLEGLDEEVRKNVMDAVEQLKKSGCQVVDVSLPYTKYAIPVYYIVVPSEDSSNLARLDGIRYGVRSDEAENLYQIYTESRAKGFPEEVKRRIMVGTYSLSAGYYDAYYKKAQKVRTLIKQDFERVFNSVDILVTPTSPFPAFGLGEKKDNLLEMYLADVFVAPASVAGLPAISMPSGFTKSGLPIGLQIIGPRMQESRIMQVGYNLEKVLQGLAK